MSLTNAFNELGIQVQNKSSCLPTDEACKKKEDAAAALAALEQKAAEEGKF